MIECACGCKLRDRHLTDCVDDACAGCLPAPALEPLRVCRRCERRAAEALRGLPGLVQDVEDSQVLRAASGASGGDKPLPIDPDAMDWRWRVRACLVAWCRILEEDFGANLADAQDTVTWMTAKVRTAADRLLAHPEHADQLVADLCGWSEDDGRRHLGLIGEGRKLAFRGRGARQRIRCSCGSWVAVDPTEFMTCPGCGEQGVLDWWRQREVGEDPAPMTLRDLSLWLALHHGRNVPERTLRGMADRGAIVPVQRQGEGVGRPSRRFDPVTVAAIVLDGHARTVMRA